jgi:hypothetical protein
MTGRAVRENGAIARPGPGGAILKNTTNACYVLTFSLFWTGGSNACGADVSSWGVSLKGQRRGTAIKLLKTNHSAKPPVSRPNDNNALRPSQRSYFFRLAKDSLRLAAFSRSPSS